jgi:hypothetical protein
VFELGTDAFPVAWEFPYGEAFFAAAERLERWIIRRWDCGLVVINSQSIFYQRLEQAASYYAGCA